MHKHYLIVFWTPFSRCPHHSYSGIFSDYLQKFGKIQCLDCFGPDDRNTHTFLQSADLIIVVLPQNQKFLDDYFSRCRARFPNVFFMVADYFHSEQLRHASILHLYRLSEQEVLTLPYTQRLCEAERNHELPFYIHKIMTMTPDAESAFLRLALLQAGYKIQHFLERLS